MRRAVLEPGRPNCRYHRENAQEDYPESELARRYGAESPEPTPDERVAYSDISPWREIEPSEWPLAGTGS